METVPAVYDACRPRPEVLSGELTDAMFAARLNEVVAGTAHPIYQNPQEFFGHTHLTPHMRALFREVLGRLRGEGGAAAVYRLDTNLGGGKTHTLIALWHLATAGPTLPDTVLAALGLSRADLPAEPVVVLAVVGEDLSPADGVRKPDGVLVRHLWGELAHCLGGAAGYQLVARADTEGLAPAVGFLDDLLADRPVLLLLDELANYLRRMPAGVRGQLAPFLQNLTEWAARPGARRALVVTLAEDVFREESREIRAALEAAFAEVKEVARRYEKVITPADREDYAPILRRRLFATVDPQAATAVARALTDLYRQTHREDFRLPEYTQPASYVTLLEKHYPFHPTLIDLLEGKLAVIPEFQKTRGALRLLCRVIRRLWQARPVDAVCLQPSHIDLADPALLEEVTGRLNRSRYRDVVETDIVRQDGQAHAQLIDRKFFGGHLPYAQRVATTILLHSLPDPPARGIHPADLRLAVLTPASTPGYITKALEELTAYSEIACWHLDRQGEGEEAEYFFSLEPNLTRIIQQEMGRIGSTDVRQEVERRLRQLFRDTLGFRVDLFPGDFSEVEDKPGGRLVVLHWDTVSCDGEEIPEKVRQITERAPGGGYRQYPNGLVFLVANRPRIDRMLGQTRYLLAVEAVTRQASQLKLTPAKLRELEGLRKEQEALVTLAIAQTYNLVFYCADQTHASLILPVEAQGRLPNNLVEVVIENLHGAQKVKRDDDPPLGAPFVIQQAFTPGETAISTEDLWCRFFARPRLPIPLTPAYVRQVVLTGVRAGHWLVTDPADACAHGPETVHEGKIRIAREVEILLPEEVKRRGLPICGQTPPPAPVCHVCGQPVDRCLCSAPVSPARPVEVEGDAGRALATLEAEARDRQRSVAGLKVLWDGQDGEVADRMVAVRQILGQLQPHLTEAALVITVSGDGDGGSWDLQYRGQGAFYLQRLASHGEGLARQLRRGTVQVSLRLFFREPLTVDGADWRELKEVFQQAQIGVAKWSLEETAG